MSEDKAAAAEKPRPDVSYITMHKFPGFNPEGKYWDCRGYMPMSPAQRAEEAKVSEYIAMRYFFKKDKDGKITMRDTSALKHFSADPEPSVAASAEAEGWEMIEAEDGGS